MIILSKQLELQVRIIDTNDINLYGIEYSG